MHAIVYFSRPSPIARFRVVRPVTDSGQASGAESSFLEASYIATGINRGQELLEPVHGI